uniref:Metallothionein n=1 Tax=Mesembryanthemum crystallinum TaxID=3544 RepID=O81530_MESCR|nr:metallothionein [Mesembryanthemum crystallinum]
MANNCASCDTCKCGPSCSCTNCSCCSH